MKGFFGTNPTGLMSNYVPAVIVNKQDSWYVHTISRHLLFLNIQKINFRKINRINTLNSSSLGIMCLLF